MRGACPAGMARQAIIGNGQHRQVGIGECPAIRLGAQIGMTIQRRHMDQHEIGECIDKQEHVAAAILAKLPVAAGAWCRDYGSCARPRRSCTNFSRPPRSAAFGYSFQSTILFYLQTIRVDPGTCFLPKHPSLSADRICYINLYGADSTRMRPDTWKECNAAHFHDHFGYASHFWRLAEMVMKMCRI